MSLTLENSRDILYKITALGVVEFTLVFDEIFEGVVNSFLGVIFSLKIFSIFVSFKHEKLFWQVTNLSSLEYLFVNEKVLFLVGLIKSFVFLKSLFYGEVFFFQWFVL